MNGVKRRRVEGKSKVDLSVPTRKGIQTILMVHLPNVLSNLIVEYDYGLLDVIDQTETTHLECNERNTRECDEIWRSLSFQIRSMHTSSHMEVKTIKTGLKFKIKEWDGNGSFSFVYKWDYKQVKTHGQVADAITVGHDQQNVCLIFFTDGDVYGFHLEDVLQKGQALEIHLIASLHIEPSLSICVENAILKRDGCIVIDLCWNNHECHRRVWCVLDKKYSLFL